MKYTDGTDYKGDLVKGQTWVKGNRERTIVDVGGFMIYYQTKTDIKRGSVTGERTNLFLKWIIKGAMLKKG
ncbi:hypothetical protein pW4_76 [Bacillus phage pW4]|uniref:Uncharacterized protein n=1 Tax=Bacillus phage pW4 TaxID=2500560 RepID=A0A3Q9R7N8_9CAUD|nr:hypothetical protein PP656_gp063 [Bacillus phage pW4]AZU99091.1 hypothetical protein pW4_76 [Bacillus phage pW4]